MSRDLDLPSRSTTAPGETQAKALYQRSYPTLHFVTDTNGPPDPTPGKQVRSRDGVSRKDLAS